MHPPLGFDTPLHFVPSLLNRRYGLLDQRLNLKLIHMGMVHGLTLSRRCQCPADIRTTLSDLEMFVQPFGNTLIDASYALFKHLPK